MEHGGHHHPHAHPRGAHDGAVATIRAAFFLNLFFTCFEIGGGLYTNSLAILSNAVHDMGDTFGIGLSWYMARVAGRQRTGAYSYGYGRFSLLAALANGAVLAFGCIIILAHAVPRILHPEPSNVSGMLLFAVVGVLVNGAAALRLKEGKTMNERVVMWHLIEDVLGWLAVLVAGAAMLVKEMPVLDPLLAAVITLYVLWNALKNLRRTGILFLQGVPESVSLPALEERIGRLEGICGLHDLHVWSMDGSYHVISLHVMTQTPLTAAEIVELKSRIRAITRESGIEHATIEVETTGAECCPPDPGGAR